MPVELLARAGLSRRASRLAAALVLLAAVHAAAAAPARKPVRRAKPAPSSTLDYKQPPPAPGDTVLLRVADRYVTLADFRSEWERLPPSQRPLAPDALTAYRVFLEDLQTRDLLAVEAQRHPRTLPAPQQADIDSFHHAMTRNQLFAVDVESRVSVDTTQTALYRKELSKILYLQAYLYPTREAAQAAYTKVVGGLTPARLDEQVAAGAPGAPQRVDLGNRIREDFNEQTARVLWQLAPGRLSAPVSSKEGWALFQVIAERTRPNSVLSSGEAGLLREMRRIKANEYKEIYRDSLAHAYKVAYVDAAMDTIAQRFSLLPPRTTPRPGGGAIYNMDQPLPSFTRSDSALVLARSTLGPLTAGQILSYVSQMSPYLRPEIHSSSQLRSLVDRVAFDRVLLRRALDLGLDRDPVVRRLTARRRERYLVEALYADSVSSRVRVSETDLASYYAADTSKWRVPESVTLWVCSVDSRARADSVLALAKAGANLEQLARDYANVQEIADGGGMTRPVTRGQAPLPELEDKYFAAAKGELVGPLPAAEGWAVFKVIDKSPARGRSFTEAHDDVARAYRNEKEEEVMQAFLARLRKRYPVEKHEELLAPLAASPGAP